MICSKVEATFFLPILNFHQTFSTNSHRLLPLIILASGRSGNYTALLEMWRN